MGRRQHVELSVRIAQALVRDIEEHARSRCFSRLDRYTDSAKIYYERLGWIVADRLQWRGFPTVFKQRDLLA